MKAASRFTWVQTHKELVQHLRSMQTKQAELIQVLASAGVKGLDS